MFIIALHKMKKISLEIKIAFLVLSSNYNKLMKIIKHKKIKECSHAFSTLNQKLMEKNQVAKYNMKMMRIILITENYRLVNQSLKKNKN